MIHKGIQAELKAGDSGEVTAIFSTFGVIDHDGDVTDPGAFEDGAKVRISAYNHASWQNALPVGKGIIMADSEQAVMEGQFFMDTTHGRDTFKTVQQLEDLGEWSYGFDILDSGPGTHDGQDVRVLRSVKVHEVSPVLLGAGIGTRTLSAKSIKDLSDEDVLEQAHEACRQLLKRGLALPSELVDAVRKDDAEAAERIRRTDMLATIAAIHGHTTGGME